jgi:hypothetical protein
MKVARFVLKIVAMSLGAAAAICAVIAYWDKLSELGGCARDRFQRRAFTSEFDDYDDYEE